MPGFPATAFAVPRTPPVVRALPAVLFMMLAAPRILFGQAPVVTPEGDPTVRDDTLYALASDSTSYPEETALTLFDDGIYVVNEDGTTSRTFRIVRQALKREAAQGLTELQFGYDAGHEVFTLNWARVVDPDSGVVSEEPIHLEELDVEVSQQSPIYTDAKRVRVSMGGVALGRILDYSYTVRDTAPILPGDLGSGWNVVSSTPIRRSRYVLDVPEASKVRVKLENVPPPTSESRTGGRWVREWSYAELDKLEPEPFAADSNGVIQTIHVSGWVSWDEIARWYAGLARDRLAPTPALRAKLDELVPEGASLRESLEAVHRWIAQDVRYISISLGLGGYQPRTADEVIASLSGDCKDKATLFVAMARALGAEAYPVLVGTGAPLEPELPSLFQFNHMVAALHLGGEWHYLDLTVPVAPFDEVYEGLQGRKGVLVKDEGVAEIVTFPASPATANRSVIEVEGTLSTDGDFQGQYTETVTGAIQYRIRAEFARSLTERQMESVGRSCASRVFADARGDSVEVFDGRDLKALPQLRARISADGVFQGSGNTRILPLRLTRYGNQAVLDALEKDTLRLFPIDAEVVFGRREHLTELRFTLPEGWTAQLPDDVLATSVFGEYESTYTQEGRTLTIRRLLRGADGVYPPERVEELVAWLRTMWEDDVTLIVLDVGGG